MSVKGRGDQAERNGQTDSGRREFLTGTAVAGLVGAGVAAAAQPAMAQGAAVRDPERPTGLGPRAMIDSRFPVMWEDTVPNGVRVLTQFFKALSQRDMKALAQTLQFPFGTHESVKGFVINSPEELFAKPPPSLNMNTNPERYTPSDGYIKAGSYDIFKGIEALAWDPVQCTLAMTYDRYDKYGKRLLRCEGIYSVTNNDGKWGIELMSTIFTPDNMVGVVYEGAIEAAKRTRINHTIGGNFNPPTEEENKLSYAKLGPAFGLAPGGQGRAFRNATEGKMMDVYKIRGVKTRLRVNNENRAETARHIPPEEYKLLFSKSGVGNFGFVFAHPQTRIIHHSADKVHMFSGANRFNVFGEHASLDTDVAVITFREAHWGMQSTFCLTQIHDRSNDSHNL